MVLAAFAFEMPTLPIVTNTLPFPPVVELKGWFAQDARSASAIERHIMPIGLFIAAILIGRVMITIRLPVAIAAPASLERLRISIWSNSTWNRFPDAAHNP